MGGTLESWQSFSFVRISFPAVLLRDKTRATGDLCAPTAGCPYASINHATEWVR